MVICIILLIAYMCCSIINPQLAEKYSFAPNNNQSNPTKTKHSIFNSSYIEMKLHGLLGNN